MLTSPADVMEAIDKAVQEIADQYADPATWGESEHAAAANAAAMARAGGPARMRRPPE